MRAKLCLGSALVLTSLALGGAPGPITLPSGPPTPVAPAPAPGALKKLSGDQLYVVEGTVDHVVRAHPKGLVKTTKVTGPVMIRGRFVDGGPAPELRKFAGPFVSIIEPTGKGVVELDVIPVGLKAESDIISDTVDVDAGHAPQPPPDPKPPDPKPVDPPIPGPGLKVLILYDTSKVLPPKQQSVLDGVAVRQWLEDNCVVGPDGRTKQYRIWPHDTDGHADSVLWGGAAKRPRASLPWTIISNGKTGFEGSLPADSAGFLELVKKYKE